MFPACHLPPSRAVDERAGGSQAIVTWGLPSGLSVIRCASGPDSISPRTESSSELIRDKSRAAATVDSRQVQAKNIGVLACASRGRANLTSGNQRPPPYQDDPVSPRVVMSRWLHGTKRLCVSGRTALGRSWSVEGGLALNDDSDPLEFDRIQARGSRNSLREDHSFEGHDNRESHLQPLSAAAMVWS